MNTNANNNECKKRSCRKAIKRCDSLFSFANNMCQAKAWTAASSVPTELTGQAL